MNHIRPVLIALTAACAALSGCKKTTVGTAESGLAGNGGTGAGFYAATLRLRRDVGKSDLATMLDRLHHVGAVVTDVNHVEGTAQVLIDREDLDDAQRHGFEVLKSAPAGQSAAAIRASNASSVPLNPECRDPGLQERLTGFNNGNRAPDAEFTDYPEMVAKVTAMVNRAPQIASLYYLCQEGPVPAGRSNGRDCALSDKSDTRIHAVRITGPGTGPKPALYINSLHHAREVMTVEAALDLIETLLSGYAADGEIKGWVDNTDIWIVPMVNPAGNRIMWGSSKARGNPRHRKNANYVDINRNYPTTTYAQCKGASDSVNDDTFRGPRAASEPETRAIMAFAEAVKPVYSISYHAYSEVVLYPGQCGGRQLATWQLLGKIANRVAKTLPRDCLDGTYVAGETPRMLYEVDGDDITYLFEKQQVMSLLIEVGGDQLGFHPPFAYWRDKTVEKTRRASLQLFQMLWSSTIQGQVEGFPSAAYGTATVQIRGTRGTGGEAMNDLRQYRINQDGTFNVPVDPELESDIYNVEVSGIPGQPPVSARVKVTGVNRCLDGKAVGTFKACAPRIRFGGGRPAECKTVSGENCLVER